MVVNIQLRHTVVTTHACEVRLPYQIRGGTLSFLPVISLLKPLITATDESCVNGKVFLDRAAEKVYYSKTSGQRTRWGRSLVERSALALFG